MTRFFKLTGWLYQHALSSSSKRSKLDYVFFMILMAINNHLKPLRC